MKAAIFLAPLAVLALVGGAAVADGHGQGQRQGQGHGQGQGPQMAHFLEEWDMNADGRVTVEDVAARRTDIFDMFDLSGDGVIDAEEQANMAATIAGQEENNREGHGVNGPGPRIHGAMTPAYNDANHDGQITAAEWAEATPRLFTELDRNADGVINPMDFGRHG